MSKNLLLDSGFWYALYDVRDPFHERANTFATYLDFYTLVIPWPSLYETLNTRFVRRPEVEIQPKLHFASED